MSQPNSPEETNIEARVRQLLAQYAEGMPRETSVEARVRDLLASQPPRRHSAAPRLPSWGRMGGWARAGVSVALVIVLLAGFFAVLRLRANTANTTHCPIIQAQGKIKLCPDQHASVSIDVLRTFADPTRTVLEIHFKLMGAAFPLGPGGALVEPDVILLPSNEVLLDSQGHTYASNSLIASAPQSASATLTNILFDEFDPLPQSMLDKPQTVTLRVTQLLLEYAPRVITSPTSAPKYLPSLVLNGQWTATIQVTPTTGRSINLRVAPQTHSGITIQPIRLDADPQPTQFDGVTGGQRLILRVSGLAPGTLQSHLAQMATQFTRSDGSGAFGSGPTNTVLTFEGQEPAYVAGSAANSPLYTDPVVGPSGVIDLEIIFVSPPLPSLTGAQKLTISGIAMGTGSDFTTAQGPWNFEIPLG